LQKRIPDLKVIDKVGNTEKIFFGAKVLLEKDNGDKIQYRIVGPDETDTQRGDISIDSPLAKALLKKEIDDEVTITIDGDNTNYAVVDITY